jgi:8-oxo-dGTP pyrophosphatase MutT (NUDIX family)
MFAQRIAALEAALRGPLPGLDAQLRMAPHPARTWPAGVNPARIRHAAGLLLLFPREDRAHIVLTVRADALGRHGGQVSFPGGAIEPGETFEQAALREAHEEIALPLDQVRTLGPLTPVDLPVSGFRLHPIVAVTGGPPALRPSDGEVARILEVPLDRLADPASVATRSLVRGGQTITAPVFVVEDAEVWGATAMVLAEFLALFDRGGLSSRGDP